LETTEPRGNDTALSFPLVALSALGDDSSSPMTELYRFLSETTMIELYRLLSETTELRGKLLETTLGDDRAESKR